ncbi:beta-ketoacyl synthase [Paraliobacillus sp. JSM ZJ581]|uniref:beta-ketoacyl-[acyl-carrier-protein] synthase family protein n=1 Tax=Paraliobacillus sp. JSM ZJ581 TaxID=3342118 RepID=UPI0035A82362
MKSNLDKKRRVVVTGRGMISPLGNNVDDSWKSLLKGDSGINKIDLFDVTDFPCEIAAQVKNIDKNDYKNISRSTLFARRAVEEALTECGIIGNDEMKEKCSVVFGNSGYRMQMPDFSEALSEHNDKKHFEVNDINNAEIYYKNRYSAAAEYLSEYFHLGGACISLTTACTSGTQSIGLAFRKIKNGEEEMIIAGGSDAMITELDLIGFCLLGAVTTNFNNNPKVASRPFNRDRSGFVLGEGGAALVLEDLEHAKSRNAKIYGEIVGFGNTISGYSMLDTHPEGEGLSLAMRKALEESGLTNEEIGYVNAHGTSTRDNDSSESYAIRDVFPLDTCSTLVSSTKSSTGHMISAAGTAELIFTLNAVNYGVLPATHNLVDIDGKCALNHILENHNKKIQYGMSNSLGFGGSNSSIIIKGID